MSEDQKSKILDVFGVNFVPTTLVLTTEKRVSDVIIGKVSVSKYIELII